jgi:uncharacterized protein (TIGR02145 family)
LVRATITTMPSLDFVGTPLYIENGVNYGLGITIGSTIWAPVNCGYDAIDYKYGKMYQWGRKYGQGYDSNDATYPSGAQIAEPIAYNAAPDADYFYKGTDETAKQWMQKNGSNNAFDGTTDWMSLKGDASPHKDNTGIGNPCPTGWRVPTSEELNALFGETTPPDPLVEHNSQNGAWFDGTSSPGTTGVFLPAAGYRYLDGSAYDRGVCGYYWSSTPYGVSAYRLDFGLWDAGMNGSSRASGLSVRCVKE